MSDSELAKLHEAALKVLRQTGIYVNHSDLRKILSDAGAVLDEERKIVKFPASMVEKAIEKAPPGFTLYERGNRSGKITLEDNKVFTHTTGGASNVIDLDNGRRRNARIKDVERAARLINVLDNVHAFSPLVTPTDVINGAEEVEMVNMAIRNTNKVIENPVTSATEVDFLFRLFAAVTGSETELKRHPSFAVSVSPISPLNFDKGSSSAMMQSAKRKLPTKLLPAPIAGATAPVTFAGALAQQHAELLAGLTILQTVSPGLPTVLSPRLSVMDMRNSFVSWGTSELGRASAAAVQLINELNLPSDVYGLSSDAKALDEQQGYEKSMNGILPALAGANFLSGAGGIESLKSASLAQMVVDNEIFGMILDTIAGFRVDADTIALEVINSVGPGGEFIKQRHTAEFARKGEQHEPELSDRSTWENWVDGGKKDLIEVATERARSLLADSEPLEIDPVTLKSLDEIMEDARSYFKEQN